VVAPRPAYQRPLDPIYPTRPNDMPFGPQSQNAFPPVMQSTDVTPATIVDPQTFMMPPVVVDQRGRRRP
jgi:hypothetical protein